MTLLPVLLFTLQARAATGQDVIELLAQSQVEDAEAALAQVSAADSLLPWAKADLAFHRGDYGAARAALRGVGAPPEPLAWLPERVDASFRVTQPMLERREGRFVFRFFPGVDAILVEDASSTLDAQADVLQRLLGVTFPGPLVVEFFATPADFIAGTGLPAQWVQTTNTVAIAKWDRLMVLSPMNSAWGYPWLDTVAHELTHLALARASRDALPIWFQEGAARRWEGAWRSAGPREWLDPLAESLLFAALRDGKLLPFSRMHPSLAALDSAGEARLAYAEAASAVSWLHEQVGDADFRRVVQTTGLHRDVMRAIDERLGGEAGSFEGRWKDWLRRQPLEARADVAELHADLTSGAATDGDREARRLDPILAENPRARTLTLVGDLLRGRGHLRSSLLEYEKAARASRFHSPSLAHKRALALLRLDQTEEARHVLQESIARYPEFTPCVSTLASLQAQAGDLAAAERTARRALALNPFDPEPRKILAAAARERGDAATVQRIGRILRVLQDHLGQ